MMTSRAEFRLILRQDNAADRLTTIGREIGLINDERWAQFKQTQKLKQAEIERLKSTKIKPCEILNKLLKDLGSTEVLAAPISLEALLKRPGITYQMLKDFDDSRPTCLNHKVAESAAIEVKYAGYIERQTRTVERTARFDKIKIPSEINFSEVHGMRLEARDKLAKHRPATLGQALRIGGVNLNDILALEMEMRKE